MKTALPWSPITSPKVKLPYGDFAVKGIVPIDVELEGAALLALSR